MEAITHGLQCDNPQCDWVDETIKFEQWQQWLNKPCPKCGMNVLTEKDYNNAKALLDLADILKGLTPDEIKEISGPVDTEELKARLKAEGVKGTECITGDQNQKIIMSVNTHEKIKITEIKPAN